MRRKKDFFHLQCKGSYVVGECRGEGARLLSQVHSKKKINKKSERERERIESSWNINCSWILGRFLFTLRALEHKMVAQRCCTTSIFRDVFRLSLGWAPKQLSSNIALLWAEACARRPPEMTPQLKNSMICDIIYSAGTLLFVEIIIYLFFFGTSTLYNVQLLVRKLAASDFIW